MRRFQLDYLLFCLVVYVLAEVVSLAVLGNVWYENYQLSHEANYKPTTFQLDAGVPYVEAVQYFSYFLLCLFFMIGAVVSGWLWWKGRTSPLGKWRMTWRWVVVDLALLPGAIFGGVVAMTAILFVVFKITGG